MSNTDPLSELKGFCANSPLASDDQAKRANALRDLARSLHPQPVRRRVTDLLSVVMALSARTRRMVLPRVAIDMDVFSPGGKRAVRITFAPSE